MNVKNFISLKDINTADLISLIDLAIKYKNNEIKSSNLLKNNIIGLLFSLPSTRTRMSFQKAIYQMGGQSEYYNFFDLQLKNGESLEDTAKVISQYLNALVIRNYDMKHYGEGRNTLNLFASHSQIPIINALDEKDHPTQVLADLLTLKDKWGNDFTKKRVLFSWGYSRRQKSLGVPHSFLSAAAMLGMKFRIAYPVGYELDKEYTFFANNLAKLSGAEIEYSNDLMEASAGVDCIYVKNWKSLSMSSEAEEEYKKNLKGWQITEECFRQAQKDAVYMDCLPSIAGEEAAESVRKGNNSIIFEQAHNRIYANEAILSWLLNH